MGINFGEGLLIAAIAILLFGGKKIPELGRTIGASVKNFKAGMKSEEDLSKNDNNKDNEKKEIS
ncbi:MAG: twin-arginine translocase TatA/TatE family subunit [Bacteriovorax sp.]|jgi:sec-independent protein translocase protein TatA|nr:twin-arginine translocase TatA/TatE family subunit [Bacteriovorax sp.]